MKALLFRRRSSATNNSRESSTATPTPHMLARPPSPFPTPPHPPRRSPRASPRPSPDCTVATRKSHSTSATNQSDITAIQSNLESDIKATRGKKRYDEWPKSSSYDLMPTTGADCDGSDSDDDGSSAVISELTAFSTQNEARASLLLPSPKLKKSRGNDAAAAPKKEKSKKKNKPDKPKSIFRSKLKYTKQINRNQSTGSTDHNKSIDRNDSSKASSAADQNEQLGISIGLSPSPSSPKTPITVASLDYSSDGDVGSDTTPVDPSNFNIGTPLSPFAKPPVRKLSSPPSTPESELSSPSSPEAVTQHYQHQRPSAYQPPVDPPSPPRRTASSLSSFSGDTFSTFTTKSSTNLSVKSAPEPGRMEAIAKTKHASNRRHRRAKSSGDSFMDELFANVLTITEPPREIDDLLAIRSSNSTISGVKSLPAQTSTGGTCRGSDDEAAQQKGRQKSNAISGMTLVKEDEARRKAAAVAVDHRNSRGGKLAPRFHGTNGKEIPPPSPIMNNQHTGSKHRPNQSREEYNSIPAPHLPSLSRDGKNQSSSLDDIERGRSSPHVQFRDDRLCSFYSGGQGGSSSNVNSGNVVPSNSIERTPSEEDDERLESEIYQTMLSMAAFNVQVEDLHDMSGEGSDDSYISSLSSSNHAFL